MASPVFHLAQINVARLVAPMEDPRIDDFRLGLDRVNALAEASPGFVWRLQDDSGNATNIKPTDDPLFIVNLTVWESIEALQDFTYRTAHAELLRRRREFFEPASGRPSVCLWWIPAGTIPTVDDGLTRLAALERDGPTPFAFTFRQRFDPEPEAGQAGVDTGTSSPV